MDELDKIKQLMDHPVMMSHDVHAKLIRAQLFLVASSTILLTASGIEIGAGSSFLGIRLEGLTKHHVLIVAASLILYQIIHFSWVSWDALCEWRIRQTALATAS